ncbi:hypothetical protein EON79_03260 [bacterium]|nr:MAG: hypothetical protein EON79_03260 [bacterium]
MTTVESLARLWSVTLERKLLGSTCSEVWAGDRYGQRVVLKLPRADAEEAKSLPVLRAFSTRGGVSILESDEASGGCLLPLLGNSLDGSELGEDENTRIFARLAYGLRTTPNVAAPSFETYAADAFSSNDAVLREPIRTLSKLLETRTQTTLTHGDLHHFNILKGETDYVVIDPKGILTDPASEVIAYIRNPRMETITPDRVHKRLTIMADAWGESYDRLAAWAWAGNIISLWWDDPGADMKKAEPFLATLHL